MLHLLAIEEIEGLLGRVSELVRLFENKESSFVDEVKGWLVQAERLLKANQLQGASELAGLRLALISAEQGIVPEGVKLQGVPSRRKIKMAASSEVLQRASKRVAAAIAPFAGQVADAERLMRQMLPLAEKKGLLPANDGPTHGDALVAVWQGMEADTDLATAAIHVLGLVGKQDTIILLDRVMAWFWASESTVQKAEPLRLTADPDASQPPPPQPPS